MNTLLLWVTNYLKVYIIPIDDRPYIERYRVGKFFGRTWYLHHFVSRDAERWLHDHPWTSAWCFVLCGRYTEERFKSLSPNVGIYTECRVINWFNYLKADTFHRIINVADNTWTLVSTGPDAVLEFRYDEFGQPLRKSWGFLTCEAVQADRLKHRMNRLIYEQPYDGERAEDFMSKAITGREYRQQLRESING